MARVLLCMYILTFYTVKLWCISHIHLIIQLATTEVTWLYRSMINLAPRPSFSPSFKTLGERARSSRLELFYHAQVERGGEGERVREREGDQREGGRDCVCVFATMKHTSQHNAALSVQHHHIRIFFSSHTLHSVYTVTGQIFGSWLETFSEHSLPSFIELWEKKV